MRKKLSVDETSDTGGGNDDLPAALGNDPAFYMSMPCLGKRSCEFWYKMEASDRTITVLTLGEKQTVKNPKNIETGAHEPKNCGGMGVG